MTETKMVAEAWQKKLASGGYEHIISNHKECSSLHKVPRIWRRILRQIDLSIKNSKNKSIFEVGCGGGKHLAPFLLNGWRAVGLDVSKEVLGRADIYLKSIKNTCGTELNVSLIEEDFFNYEPKESFDIVFHAGVIEHFLENEERLEFLKKMLTTLKPGGYLVSIVPSGIHPLREKMKDQKLGGYDIPEIDYSPGLMAEELSACGAENIKIIGHNIFNHFLIGGGPPLVKKLIFYGFQLIPSFLLPEKFSFRKAGTLIAIGRKPNLIQLQ